MDGPEIKISGESMTDPATERFEGDDGVELIDDMPPPPALTSGDKQTIG